MVWLLAGALGGLALLAGPVAIHLLTRRHARRVPFPTLRFLLASRAAAVRPRRPADLWLLMTRLAVIALAVIASARPLLLTSQRISAWDSRVARAIVVDTSGSMSVPDAAGRSVAELAAQTAQAEAATAFEAVRIDTVSLAGGIRSAVQRLDRMPPARREIVLISDFRQGALTEGDLAVIPADIGIRFIRPRTQAARRTWTGAEMHGWRAMQWVPEIAIDRASTTATWKPAGSVSSASEGITIAAASADADQAQAALKAAVSLGIPVGGTNARIAVAIGGAPLPDSFAHAQELRSPWIVETVLRLRESELLKQALRATQVPDAKQPSGPWTPIGRDAAGRVVVLAAEHNGVLLLDTPAPATSLLVPALVRAALLSRGENVIRTEQEVMRVPDEDVARWRRQPRPVAAEAWRRVDGSDARWFWGGALALLFLEGRLRRDNDRLNREEADVAAA